MDDLISRSALNEDLRAYANRKHMNGQTELANGILKAISRVKAAPTIEQPQWISVEDRLPAEGVSIEMFYPVSLSICLGYYKEIKKVPFWCVKFPDGTGRLGDEKPTHWRYRYIVDAPQPPKGVE